MKELLQSSVEAVKIGVQTAVVVRDADAQDAAMDLLFGIVESDRKCERDDDLNIPSLCWTIAGKTPRRLYVTTRKHLPRLQRLRPGIELVFAEERH